MQSVVEDRKSLSEKVKIKRTSEYVQSQIDHKNRSPSSPLPVAPPINAASCHGIHLWQMIHNYNLSAGKMLTGSNHLHQNDLTQLKLRQRLRLVELTPP